MKEWEHTREWEREGVRMRICENISEHNQNAKNDENLWNDTMGFHQVLLCAYI